jgi:phage terminase small subunit
VSKKKIKKAVKAGQAKVSTEARRKIFVEAFLANGGNATDAARTAGYSTRTARQQGSRLLSNVDVSTAIAERTAKVCADHGLTTERVLQEVARLAFSDPRLLLDEHGALKPASEWPDGVAAAIGSIEVFEEFAGQGNMRMKIGETKKVKVWDKNAALEKAMKYLGLFKNELSGPNGGPIPIALSGEVKLSPLELYRQMKGG